MVGKKAMIPKWWIWSIFLPQRMEVKSCVSNQPPSLSISPWGRGSIALGDRKYPEMRVLDLIVLPWDLCLNTHTYTHKHSWYDCKPFSWFIIYFPYFNFSTLWWLFCFFSLAEHWYIAPGECEWRGNVSAMLKEGGPITGLLYKWLCVCIL